MTAIPLSGGCEPSFAPNAPLGTGTPLRGTIPTELMVAVQSALAQPGHAEQAVAGRIVLTPDGRPVRGILTGRQRRVTGSYSSRKAGRGLVFESMNEHAFYQECEVDPRVVDYRAQPFRFEFVLDGRLRRYIPDCVRLLADGAVEVVEVKADQRYLKDPDYSAKLDQVRAICQLLGWRFTTILADQIHLPKTRRENIRLIQQDRLTAFDERHVYRARDALERGRGEGSFAEVAAGIDAPPRGEAILRALMVARIVEIELGRPLGPSSRVQAVGHLVGGGA